MSPLKTAIIILCLILLIHPSAAQPMGNSSSIKVPAVADGSLGTRGALIDITVTVVPGSGHVFIDTRPYAQVDVQGSARLAAMVAADLTGYDLDDYDLYYVIQADAPVLEGPSAGAAMTVATIAALNGWNLSPNVLMTGTVNPDGTIGPVGGISSKMSAAADYGATVFLIPKGQGEVTEIRTMVVEDGPFISSHAERVTVDLYKQGEDLGLVVVEVRDIRDALHYATGYLLVEDEPVDGEVKSDEYQRVVKPLSDRLLNESLEMYDEVVENVGEDRLISEWEILVEMQDVYADGDYYASMSLSFTSMIWLRYAMWEAEYNESVDKEAYIMSLIEETESRIQESQEQVDSSNVGIEALGAAESRVAQAERLLYQARTSGDDRMALYFLAYSYERARSAEWWLEMSEAAGTTPVDRTKLEERANRYYVQASSFIYYADSLMEESGVSSPLLSDAEDDLKRASQELAGEYYAGAAVDAMQAIVRASVAMELSGHHYENMSDRVNQSRIEAVTAILEAREAGVEPILAISALEHGDVLAETDSQRMYQYQFSRMIAETSKSLMTGSQPQEPIQYEKQPTPPALVPTQSMPINVSWFVVAMVFMARLFRR